MTRAVVKRRGCDAGSVRREGVIWDKCIYLSDCSRRGDFLIDQAWRWGERAVVALGEETSCGGDSSRIGSPYRVTRGVWS